MNLIFENKKVVYRFLKKVGGSWDFIKDKQNIPISITTDKHPNSVLYIFKSRYPSIAAMYHLGETLIAQPDTEATKKLAEYKDKLKQEEEKRIQNMWWNKD